jgi:hypothetical protein
MPWSEIIASFAVAVSAFTWWRTHRLDREHRALGTRLLKLELEGAEAAKAAESKAYIDVELDLARSSFIITNLGQVDASRIDLEPDGGRAGDLLGDARRGLPIPSLSSGKSYELLAAMPIELVPRPLKVRVTWIDPDGSPQERTLHI